MAVGAVDDGPRIGGVVFEHAEVFIFEVDEDLARGPVPFNEHVVVGHLFGSDDLAERCIELMGVDVDIFVDGIFVVGELLIFFAFAFDEAIGRGIRCVDTSEDFELIGAVFVGGGGEELRHIVFVGTDEGDGGTSQRHGGIDVVDVAAHGDVAGHVDGDRLGEF